MTRERRPRPPGGIPGPPHPERRSEPLPWHRPKPPEDDPAAARRLEAILGHPNYRQADQDIAFLGDPDQRGLRLDLDYRKAEQQLERHQIRHSIVVFGSTRITEPAIARRRAERLREACAREPGDPELKRRLAVAERIVANSRYYDVAREFGRLVGKAGARAGNGRLVVVTGGGPGMMEAANRGASDVDALSVGLNVNLPHEQYPNPYVTPELCFMFHYFAVRKLHFLLRARGLVAFPGGYGTLDELFETLTLVQTRKIRPLPVVLVGEDYWRRVFDADFLAEQGTIDLEDRDLFWYAETAEEIWEGIQQWYAASGEPLLPEREGGAA